MRKSFGIICCILFMLYLTACTKKVDTPLNSVPSSYYSSRNCILLYIRTLDNALMNTTDYLYEMSDRLENKCTLNKNEKYVFEIKGGVIQNDLLAGTCNISVEKMIYNTNALKITDYAYFINDEVDSISWGASTLAMYVIEAIGEFEETTLGFYSYPYMITVDLQFV